MPQFDTYAPLSTAKRVDPTVGSEKLGDHNEVFIPLEVSL